MEQVLMAFHKQEMMTWLEDNPNSFIEAVQLSMADKQPYSWRAAWLLWGCMEDNDPRIQPFIPEIIECLDTKGDGHQRELIKILYRMDLSEQHEGLLFDLCMNIWEKIGKAPSVRYNAFRMVVRIATNYPELFSDITHVTQSHYLESLSPGVRRAVQRMVGG